MEFNSQKDSLFINGINQKRNKAFFQLYQQYYASLCAYVNKIIDDQEQAEDIVQEVILAIYESDKSFTTTAELGNYLYKACYNNTLLFLRHQKSKPAHLNVLEVLNNLEDDDESYQLALKEELIRQLYTAIQQLPKEQQRIMLMRLEGYSWNEIATKLGVSINTIKTQRNRSMKILRKTINPSLLFLLPLLLK